VKICHASFLPFIEKQASKPVQSILSRLPSPMSCKGA
jgi:hypothetical protein